MARRFFKGADAGFVGDAESGKAIRDHFMVRMETEKRSRFFHIHEYRVIKLEDRWLEIKPFYRIFWNSKNGGYESKIVWECDGKRVSPEGFEFRYEVTEVTNLIEEVNKLYLLDGLNHSPYLNIGKCLEICYTNVEMSNANSEDKAVIEVIENYLKRKRKEKSK